jgi:SAM-dependent methyltransferase
MRSDAAEPGHSALPLSCVVAPSCYDDPDWLALHRDLERYSTDKHCFLHTGGHVNRKGWEWTQCLHGLRRLGAITPGARALGIGVGREPVIFHLAEHIAHVTATDLYDEAAWSSSGGREAERALLDAAIAACPPSLDLSRITFDNQDGTCLTYPDNSFDFCWSLSSIEHFGGHHAACRAMREMARVVRPGGIVAVATELLLLEEYRHAEYFTRGELERELIEAAPDLKLIGPVDYRALPPDYRLDGIVLPLGVHRRRRHVVLNDGEIQWTSIMLFFRVEPERI